jgi:predicted ATPase
VQSTCWYVITGAPCAGKTSVILDLERRGHPVVHETARAYIEERQSAGESLALIRADELAFEREILRRKIEIEASLSPGRITFLDRGVPDSIAYFRDADLDPNECFTAARTFRYAGVFFLERLGLQADPVRIEDDHVAARLEVLLDQAYRELGYTPVRIPLRPVSDRIAMILSQIEAV